MVVGFTATADGLDDRESFRRRFLLTHEFRRFPFSDPDLPDALLPSDWVGVTVREAFLEYNRKLRRRAERFYRDVAEEGTIVDNDDRSMETAGAGRPQAGAREAR